MKEYYNTVKPYNPKTKIEDKCPQGFTEIQRPSIFHKWNGSEWVFDEDEKSNLLSWKERQLKKQINTVIDYEGGFKFNINETFKDNMNSLLQKKDVAEFPISFQDYNNKKFTLQNSQALVDFTNWAFGAGFQIEKNFNDTLEAFNSMTMEEIYNA